MAKEKKDKKALKNAKKDIWNNYSASEKKALEKLCLNYRHFLSKCKTERECVKEIIFQAQRAGYRDLKDIITNKETLQAGDKVYSVCMNKSVVLFNIGSEPMENGMNILGAHIDSPRLDIKQNPLYEDGGLAYMDTHYYGGIKKYQWVTVPLAIHGVVAKKDGTVIDINIGEDDNDPVFCVTDLLIHLAQEQMQKNAAKVIEGENLDILVGSVPLDGAEKDAVKADTAVNVSEARQKKENTEKSAWDTVLLSRKADRPTALDYINAVFDEFIEFHGDRCFKDDGAIVGGIAMFHGMPVTVIGQQKGKNTKDNIRRNFGMPSPDGYRKALRLMKQAETFGRPIICFVDTPGAFCGLEAEERGQGEAIAKNLFEMSSLKVPVLSIVIGEGGSGGALAMAVANEVWMMENAIYSILSPEGFASILYKDSKKAPEAARVMKVTAADLKELGLIERIIPEEEPANTDTLYRIAGYMDRSIIGFFEKYLKLSGEELAEHRYERFRRM